MISIEARTHYLVLHDVLGSQHRCIALEKSLKNSVAKWTSGSRISPCWPLKNNKSSHDQFVGRQTLIFMGPIQPAELFTSVQGLSDAEGIGVWFTAGCFNVVIRFPHEANALVNDCLEWLKARACAYEQWHLIDGEITSVDFDVIEARGGNSEITDFAKRVAKTENDFLKPALQENIIASSTGLARAASVHTKTHVDLKAVVKSINNIFDAHSRGDISILDLQSRMLSMNSAMSRFSSQAFSGVPPILATECHFWIHSLLGTGSANLALSNLVGSIQNVLGETRFSERLTALARVTSNVPSNYDLMLDPELLKFDIQEATEISDLSSKPIVPLVTYFSGRDGFSSQVQTLSAPLSTIAECNSYRSNILTTTHEMSHIFVQSALAVLAPNLTKPDELAETVRIALPNFSPKNHLDSARKFVVEAAICMEDAYSGKTLDLKQPDTFLSTALETWRNEMQEILVHTFDFLYFHESQPEFYVTSIWHSWCSIPGIADRVPEYLMRTICAVSAGILDTDSNKIFDASLKDTRKLLESVNSQIDPQNDYVKIALRLVEEIESNERLKERTHKEFGARLYLVRLTKTYLFSDRVAAQLFQDHTVRSGSSKSNKAKLRYDTDRIGNALNFLRKQLKPNPSEAESIWILHCLAFDLYQPKVVKNEKL